MSDGNCFCDVHSNRHYFSKVLFHSLSLDIFLSSTLNKTDFLRFIFGQ